MTKGIKCHTWKKKTKRKNISMTGLGYALKTHLN